MFTRTIPRHLFTDATTRRVRLVNLGTSAYRIDARMRAVPIENIQPGDVLHEGPVSVGGCSTITELGRGFRAFPYAGGVPGHMATRVYGASVMNATLNMRKLWRGDHPLPESHDFMLTHCRFELDKPSPFEIGGDVLGDRTSVEIRVVPSGVDFVNWAALR